MEKLHFLRYNAESPSQQNKLFYFWANVLKPMTRLSLILLLMLFTAGVNKAWGQTDFSGIWYIDNNDSHSSSSESRWYLVPAANPQQSNAIDAYYSPNHNTTNGDPEKPFLTTYKTNKDPNSVWVVTPSTTSGYYYVIHVKTGKYVIYEPPQPNDNNKRKSMHLQNISDAGYALADKDDYNFAFTGTVDGNINISPKNRTGWYWNPAGNNTSIYYGTPASLYQNGLVGIYDKSSGNSIWHFESAILAAPTISDVDASNKVTITENNGLPSGYNVRYTFSSEGVPDDPTATSTIMTDGEYSVTAAGILKVVIERYGVVLTSVASKVIVPVNFAPSDPNISVSDDCSNEITISSDYIADIYYTTDGSEPSNTNGTLYDGPFLQNTNVQINAIAYYGNIASKNVATLDYTARTHAPVITINGDDVSITGSGTIYYTTDGTEPTESANRYTAPITLTEATGVVPIKAIAKEEGKNPSCSTRFIFISSVSDLNSIQPTDNCLVTASFDASGYTGDISNFSGTFNGGLFTITGLKRPLFNTINGGTVKNVILDNVTISGGANTGAICNEATGATRIYNCGVLASNSEMETDKDGYTKITTCSSTVSGSGSVGGIVGLLDGSSRVINCYSYANITGGNKVGGIVGENNVATTSTTLATMVMNCMFYGDIIGGSSKAPVYNGKIITNKGDISGVSNFNYFWSGASYVKGGDIDVYNCALAAETRFLQRFEFFRHLLNSNRELAAWWATGSRENKDKMMKWELETADRSITDRTRYPYPILKPVFDDEDNYMQYPSVVNIDAAHAPDIDAKNEHYNEGRKLGDFTIYIGGVGGGKVYTAPDGASILNNKISVAITDKDPERFNFNYYKVQLPYYNDCGTKNYTGNRVVTGWKIVGVSDGGTGTFTTTSGDTPADATAENGVITSTPYNFADRKCSNKDLYSVSKRVFNQGAYYDVPEGVTSITIEPYWGKAVYVSDPYLDKVYNQDMSTDYDVTTIGGGLHYENGVSVFNNDDNQKVYTTIADAVAKVSTSGDVYDNAIVLVGNTHNSDISLTSNSKFYTLMSVDLDHDNEPDYSYILRFDERKRVHPVRIDFLNVIGLGMAQKSTGGTGTYNFGIMQPLDWFEVTNTGLFRVTQFEYDKTGRSVSPIILQGGVIEQWVTVAEDNPNAANAISYYHVGGNVWFKEFHIGAHQDKMKYSNKDSFVSPHPPISVTGGDYDSFYLTGYYNTPNANYPDDAECYINGGRFGRVCGTGMQGIGKTGGAGDTGNIIWQIDNADIDEFYAGGINHAHIAEGNITTVISNSRVDLFCGGPKFGDMNSDKKVYTTATNCKFNAFFGAGYGGNSYNRRYPQNQADKSNYDWDTWVGQQYKNQYNSDYEGVDTRIDYQFIPHSKNTINVARLFVDYVSFSLATTHEVTSNLTNCTITTSKLGRGGAYSQCLGNFYGGGSLGKVNGSVNSTLTNCIVEGSVFGAGYSASTPTVSVMKKTGDKWFLTAPYYDTTLGAYMEAELPATESYTWEHKDEVNSTETAIDKDHHILYTEVDLSNTNLGSVSGNVRLTISGSKTVIGRSVYGGGEESLVGGNATVTINDGTIVQDVYGGGEAGNLKEGVEVTINGGTIGGDVYGGGAKASTNTKWTKDVDEEDKDKYYTNVYLHGGVINGRVFGGGLGQKATDAQEAIAAIVGGDVNVELNKNTGSDNCVVKKQIFGCNNLNGTPRGKVTVHIFKTQGWGDNDLGEKKSDPEAEKKGSIYELDAVYGGGNEAAYVPDSYTSYDEETGEYTYASLNEDAEAYKTNVIIEGCDQTSIRWVYGGGNSAPSPATSVTVHSCYEIGTVFGGGNGADRVDDGTAEGMPNLGANVGYTTYSYVDAEKVFHEFYKEDEWPGQSTIWSDTKDRRRSNYKYGTGKAETRLFGGTIHNAFGGSNTLGNVCSVAFSALEEATDDCQLKVGQIYGAGNKAFMDAKIKVDLGCISGLDELFGGAMEADVNDNVVLDVTSGSYKQVFGGNNKGGKISGTITVNVKEIGCKPVIIDELYGGGDEADYEAPLDPDDATRRLQSPVVNIISATSIGSVYGGGRLANVIGNPVLNINMEPGVLYSNDDDASNDVPQSSIGTIGTVFGGGYKGWVHGDTRVEIGTDPEKSVNIQGSVYGGGDNADVIGKTTVIIGERTIEE